MLRGWWGLWGRWAQEKESEESEGNFLRVRFWKIDKWTVKTIVRGSHHFTWQTKMMIVLPRAFGSACAYAILWFFHFLFVLKQLNKFPCLPHTRLQLFSLSCVHDISRE